MNLEEASFDATNFTKNRERLLAHDVSLKFFDAVVRQARMQNLLSDDHFTVDCTLIDAWATMKSFQPQATQNDSDQPPRNGGCNSTVDFRGEKRSNRTHRSTTDPEARLMRKGLDKEAKLSFSEYVLTENRNGLCLDLQIGEATQRSERHAALAMLSRQGRKRVEEISGWFKTVGGLRKTRFIGIKRTQEYTFMVGAAYNLPRMSKLVPAEEGT